MSQCLKDQTLLLLYDGEGTSAQRTHLTECEGCAARYRQLRHDLEAISQLLRGEPPPKTVNNRFRPLRWLPATVAVALALVLIWEGVRMWNPSARPPLQGTSNLEAWTLVGDFSTDLFLLNEAIAEELWTEITDSYELATALEAGWLCEWYDMPGRREVEYFDGDFGGYASSILCGT